MRFPSISSCLDRWPGSICELKSYELVGANDLKRIYRATYDRFRPDGTTIWSTSKINGHVYAYSPPDLEYLGGVPVGIVPDWLTFTPDGKYLYAANAHSNTVSVIDVDARKEVKVIPVGQVPKRNITAILPSFPTGQ